MRDAATALLNNFDTILLLLKHLCLIFLLPFFFEVLSQLFLVIENFLQLRVRVTVFLLRVDPGMLEPINLRFYNLSFVVFMLIDSLLIGTAERRPLLREGNC